MSLSIVLAVMTIVLALVGLVGLWVYSRSTRPAPARRARRNNADLIVVHRVGPRKKRRALAASAQSVTPSDAAPDDDSRWRRPGFASVPTAPNERAPLPYYEPNKPRHVYIAHTPSVIIPHETVDAPRPPRVSQRTQRLQPTALIKTIHVDKEKPAVRAGRLDMGIAI